MHPERLRRPTLSIAIRWSRAGRVQAPSDNTTRAGQQRQQLGTFGLIEVGKMLRIGLGPTARF